MDCVSNYTNNNCNLFLITWVGIMEKSMHSLPRYASINDKPLTRRSSAFDFRAGSDVCPTCGGTGKVPKGVKRRVIIYIVMYV